MTPPISTLGIGDSTVEHLQSLIQTHLSCKRRCDRCLERVGEPIARAELRRLSAMHDRQASDLQNIVWSNFSEPADSGDAADVIRQTWEELKDGLTGTERAMEQVAAREESIQEAYCDAIDAVPNVPLEKVLRRHSRRIADATVRLETVQGEASPI